MGAFGFGGQTTGTPSVSAKSLFLGAGPRVAIENKGRVEPWVHGLVGWEHLRFCQGPVLGSNSALGYMLGAGFDVKLGRQIYWRIQGDYIGTHFQSDLQSNWSAGTGLSVQFLLSSAQIELSCAVARRVSVPARIAFRGTAIPPACALCTHSAPGTPISRLASAGTPLVAQSFLAVHAASFPLASMHDIAVRTSKPRQPNLCPRPRNARAR